LRRPAVQTASHQLIALLSIPRFSALPRIAMRHLVSLSTLAAAAVLLAACSKTETAPEPIRAVRTMVVSTDAAGGSYEYAAEVRARTESRLGFRVGGKLIRRFVDAGATVKAGQVLAQLDPQDLRLGQDAARAALSAAQANYDQTAADYKRYKDLRDQGFISSADLERRDTALKAAAAQLEQAKAQASVQGNQTAYSTLVADANGVITGVDAEPGTVVAAGAPVVRLAQDGPRDVVFSVPEDKVNLVKALAGQPGRFKVRMWGSNETLPASIREVGAAADPVTRTFTVKADLGGDASKAVRLGQTATMLVEMPKTVGVNKLPLSALKEEQGQTIVWVVDKSSMTVKPQKVQVAGADGNEAVIAGGLAPGQVVVTAGVHVLNPGQKVKFYADPAAAAKAPAANGTAVSVK
jgi:RND family efflux transporter MFP subunit